MVHKFKILHGRITPSLFKYFGQILWYLEDLGDDWFYAHCDDGDSGFKDELEFQELLEKLTKRLALPITFNRKKVELDKEYQEEIAFLIYFIKSEQYRWLADNYFDSTYDDFYNNYLKVRAFIKLNKLKNPNITRNSEGLEMEIRREGITTPVATFKNLEMFFQIDDFLEKLRRFSFVFLPEDVRTTLENPNASEKEIKSLISKETTDLNDSSKLARACGVIMLRDYLKHIPPFNETLPEDGESGEKLNLTNDMIRLIYPLYEIMEWEEKADKKEAYIKTFRKRVIHFLPKIKEMTK